MTEKEKLVSLIDEGYRPHMIIRTISEKEKRSGLSRKYWDKEVYALPLLHHEKQNLMYCFVEDETLTYAEELVKEVSSIIGYHLCVYCSVTSPEAVQGHKVYLANVIENLKEVKGWEVKESKYPNVFEVHFEIEGDNADKLEQNVELVRQVCLALSLKNKMGITVEYFSPGPKYKAQPFSITFGLPETFVKPLAQHDWSLISKFYSSVECHEAAVALQVLYSQINETAKITVGWAAIEEIFGGKAKHLLSKGERKQVVKKLREVGIDEERLTRIKNWIDQPWSIPKESRNEAIARKISTLINEDYGSVLTYVKNVTKTRGKLVHSLGQTAEINEHIRFIERVLYAYIKQNYG